MTLVGGKGNVIKDYRYDTFGNEEINQPQTYGEIWNAKDASIDNPFRYCGEYYDNETGFYYLRARYYDPSIGRFITEDPARSGMNWYVYCGNNPVMYVDPTGYEMETDAGEFGDESFTYAILVKLGDMWRATDDQAERDKIHGLAEDVRKNARDAKSQQTVAWGVIVAGFKILNYDLSADLLYRSLSDNPEFAFYDVNSSVSKKICDDSEFNKYISKILSEHSESFEGDFYGGEFSSNKDFKIALHKYNLHLKQIRIRMGLGLLVDIFLMSLILLKWLIRLNKRIYYQLFYGQGMMRQ